MKRLACVLMAVGVLVAVIAFNLDVTVGDSGLTNINMMAQRQNLLIVGCVGFLGGILLFIGALQQGASKAQAVVPEQKNERVAVSVKAGAIAFWKQRDLGRKIVLGSASLLLLSFCFPWEVSSMNFATGPYTISRTWIEISQAAIGLLLWAYPCHVSATRAAVNSNGLMINGAAAALWIGSVAYKFHSFHNDMAEQTIIHMENGTGFWLGLIACVGLLAGIVKIVTATADQSAEQVVGDSGH